MSTFLVVVALAVSFGIMTFVVRRLAPRVGGTGTDWKKVGVFYGVMLLGMLASELYNSLTKNQPINWTGLIAPLLVSPIIFGIVYSSLGNLEINVPSLVLSFQNGFFWSAVWKGLQPNQGGTGNITPTITPTAMP